MSIRNHLTLGVLASLAVSFAPAAPIQAEATSLTEQCPELLTAADRFAQECITKAQTHIYQGTSGYTSSGTVYFLPTKPESHFSLGCMLNHKDRNKFDYIGIYYATKGSNFTLANTSKAEWRNVDSDGNIGLIAEGEPLNLVLVRPFDTGTVAFSNEGFGMHYLIKDKGRIKNCESPVLPDGAVVQKSWHVERKDSDGAVAIRTCFGSDCGLDQFRKYDDWLRTTKRPHAVIGDGAFDGPFDYAKFFYGMDHQIVYGNLGFFIESDGGLLIRKSVLNDDCGLFSYLTRGSHKGNFTIPNIAQEVCKVPH